MLLVCALNQTIPLVLPVRLSGRRSSGESHPLLRLKDLISKRPTGTGTGIAQAVLPSRNVRSSTPTRRLEVRL